MPRTFLGPLFISLLISPIAFLLQLFDVNKFWCQYLGSISFQKCLQNVYDVFSFTVRAALGLTVIAAFNILCRTFQRTFGLRWLQWFIAITVTQSHFMFYLSRPLPNIFALPLGKKQLHQKNCTCNTSQLFYSSYGIR